MYWRIMSLEINGVNLILFKYVVENLFKRISSILVQISYHKHERATQQ